MKKLKTFENFNVDQELLNSIKEYLEEKYTEDWWNEMLGERAYDYVGDEEIIGYGDEDEPDYESAEDAYVGLAMGGAIEYDLLGEIAEDICKKFDINEKDYYDSDIDEIVKTYMMEKCNWCDKFLFGSKKIGEDDFWNKFDIPDETSDGIKL